MTKEPYRRPN